MRKRAKNKGKAPSPTGAHKAFLESGGHLFLGEKLTHYGPSRIVVAQAMGLLYPKIGTDGLAQLKKNGLYPGELKDIIIVLWLCRLKTKEQVDEARLDPTAAYAEAEKWAGKIGLCDMTSDVFGTALLVYQLIMNEISDSKTTPVKSSGGSRRASHGGEEEDDPND